MKSFFRFSWILWDKWMATYQVEINLSMQTVGAEYGPDTNQ
jgi:hypothetical protein